MRAGTRAMRVATGCCRRGWCARLLGTAAAEGRARSFSTAVGASTSSSSLTPLSQLLEAMTRRPAKLIPDYLTPMPSHLLTTTLDDLFPLSSSLSSPSSPIISDPPRVLPPGHHLVYFPIQLPPSRLVPDGTDPDHSPDPAVFTRRVWAGGEVVFRPGWRSRLVLDGRAWLCREDIAGTRLVPGKREGEDKVFVDVRRRYGLGHDEALAAESSPGVGAAERADDAWEIEERRTLAFMRDLAPAPGSEPPTPPPSPVPPRIIKSPHRPDFKVSLTPSAAHLFNFSALTFNAHAIHLDRRYAAEMDGHRSLLVHGPLTLALMLRALESQVGGGGSMAGISYRNHAPLYVDEELTICLRRTASSSSPSSPSSRAGGVGGGVDRWDVWLEGPDGGLAVKGSALVESR